MKKVMILILVVAVMLVLVSTVTAEVPAPGGPFTTWFRVQNMDDSEVASCSYKFFDSLGVESFSSGAISINPEDSLYVYVGDLSLTDGQYSAVVSCDKPAAAAVNFSDADSDTSHDGVAVPSTTWYAPSIMDDYYCNYSNVVVQNTTGGQVDITLDIYQPGSGTVVYHDTKTNVPAYASVNWDQSGLTELAQNGNYSARITATGNVAAIVNQYGVTDPAHLPEPCTIGGRLYSFNALPSGSTGKIAAPVIMNFYYGWRTAIVVQNIGPDTADYKITYSNATIKTGSLPAYSSAVHYTPNEGLPAGNTLYGATIETTNGKPLVVLVNQSNVGDDSVPTKNKNRADSYTGFDQGAPKVYAPMLMKSFVDTSGAHYNSSISCQNLGTESTAMELKFYGASSVTTSPVKLPGESHVFYVPNSTEIGTNWFGSATVRSTATTPQPIACIINANQNEDPEVYEAIDKFFSYNALLP